MLEEQYGGSPWNESTQENTAEARHLIDAASSAGTVTAVALDRGRLVGIAQGAVGETFLQDLRAVAPAIAGTVLPPVFELRQLVLAQAATGQGVGGRLHDVVMGEAGNLPALLLTHPGASAALSLYARRDWKLLAHTSFGAAHPRVILGRDVTH